MEQDHKFAAANNLEMFVSLVEHGLRKYHVVAPHRETVLAALAGMKNEIQTLKTLQEIAVPAPEPQEDLSDIYGDVGDNYDADGNEK